MSDSIYVDTSFFIATQILNHPFHAQALNVLRDYPKSKFNFSLLTIDEIIFILTKQHINPEQIAKIIKEKIVAIRNTRLLSYKANTKHIDTYVQIWKTSGLGPRDAMHVYFMRQNSIQTIATFDSDFKRNRKQLGITVIGLPETATHSHQR